MRTVIAAVLAAAITCACGPAEPELDAGSDACAAPCPCYDDSHCGALRCDVASGRCTECVVDDDCDRSRPHCVAGVCSGCETNGDCTNPLVSWCDDTIARPTCSTCFYDEDCAHLPETPACDDARRCVECDATDRSACGGLVCDVRARSCSDRAPHTRDVCDECVSDEDCQEGQLCVVGIDEPEGPAARAYCFWRFDAPAPGPAGSCFAARPAVQLVLATSVTGVRAGVCIPRASCPGLQAFGRECELAADAATHDAACGSEHVGDGVCAPAADGRGACTVECASHEQCPCADESCSSHHRCSVLSDDGDRACSPVETCSLADPGCWLAP